jgi:branched-chain amino acid transport system permease protein
VTAAILGGTYTLLGLSWVVIYQGTRVLNFGIGQLMFYGALMLSTASASGLPYIPALLVGILGAGIVAGVTYISVVRPLTGRDAFSTAVLAIGVSIMMTALASIFWGPDLRTLPRPLPSTHTRILGAGVNWYNGLTLVVAVTAVTSLLLFFRYAPMGLRMRAAAESPLLASQRGINVFLVYAVVWFISGVLAALGGITYASTTVVSPSIAQLGLRGIAPALVGGFRSIGGATAGAFMIALIEVVGAKHLGGQSQDAIVFACLLALIMVRPEGLVVRKEVRRV